jgi:hypothetical protein
MITSRQFYFSAVTGGVLMAAGAGLVSVGFAGGGLFLVGAAISALAVAFRFRGRMRLVLQRVTLNHGRDDRALSGMHN